MHDESEDLEAEEEEGEESERTPPPPPKSLLDALARTRDDIQRARLSTENRVRAWLRVQIFAERDLHGLTDEQFTTLAKTVREPKPGKAPSNRAVNIEKMTIAELRMMFGILLQWPTPDLSALDDMPTVKPLLNSLALLQKDEDKIGRDIAAEITNHVVWNSWLGQVRGIGPVLAAPLLTRLSPESPHRSSWFRYCGLHCENGDAARRMKGQKASWNSILKSHLIYRIGNSFIKSRGSYYRKHYDQFKARYEARPPVEREIGRATAWVLAEPLGGVKVGEVLKVSGKNPPHKSVAVALLAAGRTTVLVKPSKGHIHAMARRAAVKVFLGHLWEAWRTAVDLPIEPPYAIAHLHHTGYISYREAVEEQGKKAA